MITLHPYHSTVELSILTGLSSQTQECRRNEGHCTLQFVSNMTRFITSRERTKRDPDERTVYSCYNLCDTRNKLVAWRFHPIKCIYEWIKVMWKFTNKYIQDLDDKVCIFGTLMVKVNGSVTIAVKTVLHS